MFKHSFIILIIPPFFVAANDYEIRLKSDGPIVKGGTINFYASIYYNDQPLTNEDLKYEWEDNAIPQHKTKFEIKNPNGTWTVAYNASIYPEGTYIVQVTVTRCIIVGCWDEIGSARIYFDITETLNGVIQLEQHNTTRKDHYISNKETVTHIVDVKKSDKDYIRKAPTILTYWFVDCTYYGITTDFRFPFNYTTADESHSVEALVVADFTPLPPSTTVPPSTTTTKPTTTTTSKPTIVPITTSQMPNSTAISTSAVRPFTVIPTGASFLAPASANVKSIHKRNADVTSMKKNDTSRIMVKINGTLVPYNGSFPFICNGTQVTTDATKTYGYFFKKIEVKAPLSKPNVTGNDWLQPGDMLSLRVSCSGSQKIEYCVEYERGEYNVTGNETCFIYLPLDKCDFTITRFLSYPKNTIIIIIRNDVSKVVTPVTVNIYEVTKQGQLSVIVVPVAFSLVAVVLIVFGVAYYIQNRSRFVIEVADFNFGQQYSDIEYKTFRERLRDSIIHAFTRGPSPSTSEVPVWPPGQKYGSMT